MNLAISFEPLRTQGIRLTVARKAILALLTNESVPLSVSDLFARLRKQKISVDKVTVYRELDFLEGQGIVHRVSLQDRHRRYELASREHHHHLICQACRGVKDIVLDERIETQLRAIAKQKKFLVQRHALEFFGLCHACQ